MITPISGGIYKLFVTKQNQKILQLDAAQYEVRGSRDNYKIHKIARKNHKTDCVLSIGRYQTYRVVEERNLSEYTHLEMEVGKDMWQGYLLPSGLPASKNSTARLLPTTEKIASNRESIHKGALAHKAHLSNREGEYNETALSIKYR